MDGSLAGQDFTAHIAAAWGLSALVLGALTARAMLRYRQIMKDQPRDRDS